MLSISNYFKNLFMFTFITPTYNRYHTLERLFNSINNQTFKAFDWLIIDDGSEDQTKELIESFKSNANFEITYVYKSNGGKHTALIEAKKHLKQPYVVIIDSDDEVLPDCLEIFKKHIESNSNLDEIRGRCVDSKLNLLQKFNFPKNEDYIDTTWHEMVLKNRNDEELLSCFKLEYYNKAVVLPEKLIFSDKIKFLSEAYFWSRIKNTKIRYIKDPLRIYHNDSGNSLSNNLEIHNGLYNDVVCFKYFLDLNYMYFFWRPKYFITQYIKLNIACSLIGYGFIKSHFIYDKFANRFISIMLTPFSFLFLLNKNKIFK